MDGYFVVKDSGHEEVSGSGGNGRVVNFCPVKRVWFGVEEVYVCMDEEVDSAVLTVGLVCGRYSAPFSVFADDVVFDE